MIRITKITIVTIVKIIIIIIISSSNSTYHGADEDHDGADAVSGDSDVNTKNDGAIIDHNLKHSSSVGN